MLAELDRYIQTKELLTRDAPVLVGVSGGADSLSALIGLHRLGFRVVCAHFDHQLRPDSRSDLEFVQAFANAQAIPFVSGTADVRTYRRREAKSLEEAGRDLRYQFLFREARAAQAQAVVTGHNADDQVETVLMHFLRGAGLNGLKGMTPSVVLPTFDPALPLVRPLLGIDRSMIIQFCEDNGIKYRTDSSNEDQTFFRNRMRNELIPLLETYNPGFRKVVQRSATVLGMEQDALEGQVDEVWRNVLVASAGEWVQLDRDVFLASPAGFQARMLRRAAQQLRPALRDFDFAAVMRGLASASAGAVRRSTDLVDGLKLLVEEGVIWIAEDWGQLPLHAWPQIRVSPEKLPVPGEIMLKGDWCVTSEWVTGPVQQTDGNSVVIDADRLGRDLELRRRSPGDRFAPAGMSGHTVKLSDYMVNEKLPKRARADWPLLVSGDEIVWVAGMRLSEHYMPNEGTRRFLRLKLTRR